MTNLVTHTIEIDNEKILSSMIEYTRIKAEAMIQHHGLRLSEFLSVKYSLPRQSGLTTAAFKIADSRKHGNAFIVAPKLSMLRHFRTSSSSMSVDQISRPSVLMGANLQDYDLIIADPWECFSEHHRDVVDQFHEKACFDSITKGTRPPILLKLG